MKRILAAIALALFVIVPAGASIPAIQGLLNVAFWEWSADHLGDLNFWGAENWSILEYFYNGP